MKTPIIVIGAGGHAAVIADALLAAGEHVIGFTDHDQARWGMQRCGRPVLGDDAMLERFDPTEVMLANGIGSIQAQDDHSPRVRIQRNLESRGWRFASIRHPSAAVSPFASVGEGVQLMAGVIVQAHAVIGAGTIVNTAAVVEHDVMIEDWVHIAPRAVICGDVRIGRGSHIGANAVLKNGISLGASVVVGVGAAVVASYLNAGVLAGVPARPLDRKA